MSRIDSIDLKKRSKDFAHECVKLASSLPKNALGRNIENQLIRCSTSVAANYRAACVAGSKPSFIAKLGIVIEEADESSFWLEFILDERLLDASLISPLLIESKELTSIFISSRKTAKKQLSD